MCSASDLFICFILRGVFVDYSSGESVLLSPTPTLTDCFRILCPETRVQIPVTHPDPLYFRVFLPKYQDDIKKKSEKLWRTKYTDFLQETNTLQSVYEKTAMKIFTKASTGDISVLKVPSPNPLLVSPNERGGKTSIKDKSVDVPNELTRSTTPTTITSNKST